MHMYVCAMYLLRMHANETHTVGVIAFLHKSSHSIITPIVGYCDIWTMRNVKHKIDCTSFLHANVIYQCYYSVCQLNDTFLSNEKIKTVQCGVFILIIPLLHTHVFRSRQKQIGKFPTKKSLYVLQYYPVLSSRSQS